MMPKVCGVNALTMNKNTFVKRVVIAGGFLFLSAAPRLIFGQANPPAAAPPVGIRPAYSGSAPDFHFPRLSILPGVTLTDDQKAKIKQIREDTKSHFAGVGKDPIAGPRGQISDDRGLPAN
jgi:hypothetical protein